MEDTKNIEKFIVEEIRKSLKTAYNNQPITKEYWEEIRNFISSFQIDGFLPDVKIEQDTNDPTLFHIYFNTIEFCEKIILDVEE